MAAPERSMDTSSSFLQKFRLYETRSVMIPLSLSLFLIHRFAKSLNLLSFFLSEQQNFYMIGRDKNRTFWKVLKLDRTEQTELNFHQDSTPYTESECFETLRRIHEGNRSAGGLKFVTTCYGIIGNVSYYTKSCAPLVASFDIFFLVS